MVINIDSTCHLFLQLVNDILKEGPVATTSAQQCDSTSHHSSPKKQCLQNVSCSSPSTTSYEKDTNILSPMKSTPVSHNNLPSGYGCFYTVIGDGKAKTFSTFATPKRYTLDHPYAAGMSFTGEVKKTLYESDEEQQLDKEHIPNLPGNI